MLLTWPPRQISLNKYGLTDENSGQFQVTFGPTSGQQWVIPLMVAGLASGGIANAEMLFGVERFPFEPDGRNRMVLQYWQLDTTPAGVLVGGGRYEFPDPDKARSSSLRSLYVSHPNRVFVSILGAGTVQYQVTGQAFEAPFDVDMSPLFI